jgi:hypothetical protein
MGSYGRTNDRKWSHGCWGSLLGGEGPRQNASDNGTAMSGEALRAPLGGDETRAANRSWWDGESQDYYAEHGAFLGDAEFVWGPEGWTEDQLDLVQVRDGMTVLEIGAGAAQCSRWLARTHDVRVVASDLSMGMLRQARRIDGAAGADAGRPASDSSHHPLPPPPVRRPGDPAGRCQRRPGLHGVRGHPVRGGQRRRHAGGRPGAATRGPVRVLDVAPGALGLPRRPRPCRPDGDDLVLRPHALRRT